MRVLHICNSYEQGGLGNLVLDLHRNSRHTHEALAFGSIGAMKDEMQAQGMRLWDGVWPDESDHFDLWVSHTSGGWNSNEFSQNAHKVGTKCVEHMVSNGRSSTSRELLDGFIAPNNSVSLANNSDFRNAVALYDPIETWKLPKLGNPLYIGKSGRIVPEKASDVFAAIAKAIPEKKFLLIGGGNMEGYIRSMQVSNLQVTGLTSQEISTSMLRNVYLYVYPTRDDSYGRTLAQAMAMEIPVICQDLPQLRETCGEYAVYCKTVDDFVRETRSYFVDTDRFEKQAQITSQWAIERYGKNAITEWDKYIERFA